MATFQKVRIKDICKINPDSIGRNFNHKMIEYVDISSVGIGNLAETQEVDIQNSPSRAKRLVKSGDIIISTVRPNRRSFFYFKNPKENTVVSTGFAVLRALENNNPRYLYYSVTDQSFTAYLTKNAKGSAYPAVDADIIYDGEVFVPENIETQTCIASVLSAYDDLIENNEKRIKRLEEMAQLLYTEWFVKFKFPGHEKSKMVDSGTEYGKIPQGWEVKKLVEVSDVMFGFNFKSNKFADNGEGVRVVRIRDVLDGITNTFTSESPGKKYEINCGDLLIGMDGIFHMKMWFVPACCLNQRVARIRSILPTQFIYESIKKELSRFQKTIVGATVGHLANGNVKGFELLVPSDQKMTQPFQLITELILNMRSRSLVLQQTRDLLIPQLVTGRREVRV